MIAFSGAGIPDEEALNIYTDGSSFPNKKRAAGIGVRFVWTNDAGDEQTLDYSPTGWESATIDEMEIQACIVALKEAVNLFPDLAGFKKILLFSDSSYVTNNFSSAMNVWPAQGWRGANKRPVENIDLWKKLKKAAEACPIKVDVRWVKAHKTNVHNKAADRLAKESASNPFNKPLSISQTTRKWSPLKTKRGSIPVHGQEIKIRIISTEHKKHDRSFEYRYEVIDPEDLSFQEVDFVQYDQVLSRNKCLLVRLNSNPTDPRIEEVVLELNPNDYRPPAAEKPNAGKK